MTLTLVDLIPAAAGMLLSLLFGFMPKLSDWFDALTDKQRAAVMLIALLVTSVIIVTLSCINVTSAYLPAVPCNQLGITSIIDAFFKLTVVNQSTYFLTRKFK